MTQEANSWVISRGKSGKFRLLHTVAGDLPKFLSSIY